MKYSSTILTAVILALFCVVLDLPAQEKKEVKKQEHTTDSLDTVKKNIEDKKAILLDVRELSEWEAGHLKDAKLLPLSTIKKTKDKMDEALSTLPKDQIIYVHCAAGVRVLTAAPLLQKLGYDARPLKEGFKDLLKAGFVEAGK